MAGHRMRFLFLVLTLSALAEGNSSEQSQVKLKTAIVADVELVQIPVIVFNDKGRPIGARIDPAKSRC